jgi:hypothetical protein
MKIINVTRFVHKVALCVSTAAVNRRLSRGNMATVTDKRKVLSVKEKLQLVQLIENVKKKKKINETVILARKFDERNGLGKQNKNYKAFERNGSRRKRFRKPNSAT